MTVDGRSIVEGALRLVLAVVLALPIGWQRERRSRSAGLRTYPLLSACVCGFMLLARGRAGGPVEQADVFYGVLTGIGFVASGAVLESSRRGGGMSTAASLWATGAIGAGAAYDVPAVSAAVSLASVVALSAPWVARRLRRMRTSRTS